jgi:hypothetical protein
MPTRKGDSGALHRKKMAGVSPSVFTLSILRKYDTHPSLAPTQHAHALIASHVGTQAFRRWSGVGQGVGHSTHRSRVLEDSLFIVVHDLLHSSFPTWTGGGLSSEYCTKCAARKRVGRPGRQISTARRGTSIKY